MGAISIDQLGHLFWLGRYLERVKITLTLSDQIYDSLLDYNSELDVHGLCEQLAIPDIYESPDDFISKYLFDAEDPNSVMANLNRAFDNAIVIRDSIQSVTLSYVQLAINTMKAGAKSVSPMLEVQETLDYIYAFWGALDDFAPTSQMRYVCKTGGTLERLDLALRMGRDSIAPKDLIGRLVNRLYRSGMNYDPEALQRITEHAERDDCEQFKFELLCDIEGLIRL